MSDRKSINHWDQEDRPREKMMAHGACSLSNAELFAILIGSGNSDESAVELMRKVLDHFDNDLSRLGRCSCEELCMFKGIGNAKAVAILASMELGKRRKDEEKPRRIKISSPADIYNFFYPIMCDLSIEECWALYLNQASNVIDRVRISSGGLASTCVDIRCVLREALLKRATTLALCHNHPSGNVVPSLDDDRLTEQLSKATKLMNIRLIDHVIFTDGKYYSYADEGKL